MDGDKHRYREVAERIVAEFKKHSPIPQSELLRVIGLDYPEHMVYDVLGAMLQSGRIARDEHKRLSLRSDAATQVWRWQNES